MVPWRHAGAAKAAGTSAPTLSRGIHPDSLAAWFADLSVRQAEADRGVVARALELGDEEHVKSVPELDAELNAALRDYREALEEPAQRALCEQAAEASIIRTPELYSRVNGYLGLLASTSAVRSAGPEAPLHETAPVGRRVFTSTDELAARAQQRVQTALRPVADFVTPRDLYVCDNLREVGRV